MPPFYDLRVSLTQHIAFLQVAPSACGKPHFSERRPSPVLLPESFCIPLRRRGGYSAVSPVTHHPITLSTCLFKVTQVVCFCQERYFVVLPKNMQGREKGCFSDVLLPHAHARLRCGPHPVAELDTIGRVEFRQRLQYAVAAQLIRGVDVGHGQILAHLP